MITDENYRYIVDDVYDVDSNKVNNPIKGGRLVANDQFRVLQVEDNHKNGMQAMAVAPVDVNGMLYFTIRQKLQFLSYGKVQRRCL